MLVPVVVTMEAAVIITKAITTVLVMVETVTIKVTVIMTYIPNGYP